MFDWNGGGRIARWLGIAALVTVPALGGCEQMERGREGRDEQQTGDTRGERLQQESRESSQHQEELLGRRQDLQGEAQEARQQQEELAQREQQLEGQLQQTEQQLQQEQARSQQLGQQAEQFEQQREQQLAQQQQREQSQQRQQDVQRQQQQAQREQQQAQQDQQRMQQEQQRPQQQQQLAQQDQQGMQQQQQPGQQQPAQQPLQGGQGAVGAMGGAAAGAAIAGRQQQQGQGNQQPAIEGQVRGTVQQVDLAQGTLVIDAQGQRVRLRAQPSDIAELNQGDSVTLPFASFGDAQWVISEGGAQEMTQMFRGTQRLQGVVSNVDKNNGTITIEGREISGHPQQLAQVMPGQSVSVQVAQVENRPWIAELQTSGATAQLGQQQQGGQQQGGQQQGEQPAQG